MSKQTQTPDRIVVMGSNSFSGSHFVAHLLSEGSEVLGISRSPEPIDVFLAYKWKPHDRFQFRQLDLNHELPEIMREIDDFRPEYIVNFAAQGMVGQSWQKPEDWFMTNTVSMVNLHDQLRTRAYLKSFVQASTPEVYGNTEGLVREDHPFSPSTPYAVSKAACDMSLLAFHKTYGFPVKFTRAANVCGPGQQLYRIIPKTILSILTGEKLRLEGGGTSVRSFIDIEDVCRGTSLIMRRGKPGECYHLSTDRRTTIRELVELICRKLEVGFDDAVEMAPARKGQDAAYLLDCTKIQRELGWKPEVKLEAIIDKTVDWLQSNLDKLKKQPFEYVHKP